jgi:hypothetical protein
MVLLERTALLAVAAVRVSAVSTVALAVKRRCGQQVPAMAAPPAVRLPQPELLEIAGWISLRRRRTRGSVSVSGTVFDNGGNGGVGCIVATYTPSGGAAPPTRMRMGVGR